MNAEYEFVISMHYQNSDEALNHMKDKALTEIGKIYAKEHATLTVTHLYELGTESVRYDEFKGQWFKGFAYVGKAYKYTLNMENKK